MEFGCTLRIMVFPQIHISLTYNTYMFTHFDGAVMSLTCIHYGIQVNGD